MQDNKKAKKSFIDKFKAARRAAVPLVAVRTLDAFATEAAICEALSGNGASVLPTPLISWNINTGWQRLNLAGEQAIRFALQGAPLSEEDLERDDPPRFDTSETINRVEALLLARKLPGTVRTGSTSSPGAVVIAHGLSRFITEKPEDADVVQALLDLRDLFKMDLRMLVLLGPDFNLPAELAQHVVILDEPLPDEPQIGELVSVMTKAKGLKLSSQELNAAVGALRGLAHFPAEQALAMCTSKAEGLDLDALWENKRQIVNQTPGLRIWNGKESLSDVGGCSEVKEFLRDVLAGRNAPQAIVHMDEVEKMLAGSEGDTSGVSGDFLGELLQQMADNEYPGLMAVGVAGCAKSLIAKAAGSITGIPTIRMSLGEMKGSLVGQSQQNLRQALKIIEAVSGGSALFIATSNNLSRLPAEFRARFTLGTWFFDLPDEDEAALIWRIWLDSFKLKDNREKLLKKSANWTGREIKQACELAYRTGKSVESCLARVVPVAQIDAKRIQVLREEAAQGFLWASKPGIYQMPDDARRKQAGSVLSKPGRMLERASLD